MSASKVFSRGDLQVRGIWVWFCFAVWPLLLHVPARALFVPQVLEAVGRKDLRTAAPVRDSSAGADSGRGSATNDFRLTAVRSLPPLHEAPHKLLPAALPSHFHPSGRCDPRPPYGPRPHSGFLPGAFPVPAVDGHCGCSAVS